MDTEREDIAVLFKYFYFKNCLKEKLKILITELTKILERNRYFLTDETILLKKWENMNVHTQVYGMLLWLVLHFLFHTCSIRLVVKGRLNRSSLNRSTLGHLSRVWTIMKLVPNLTIIESRK